MPAKPPSPQYQQTPSSHNSALNGPNAQRAPIQGAYGADVSIGSDGGWCQGAVAIETTIYCLVDIAPRYRDLRFANPIERRPSPTPKI